MNRKLLRDDADGCQCGMYKRALGWQRTSKLIYGKCKVNNKRATCIQKAQRQQCERRRSGTKRRRRMSESRKEVEGVVGLIVIPPLPNAPPTIKREGPRQRKAKRAYETKQKVGGVGFGTGMHHSYLRFSARKGKRDREFMFSPKIGEQQQQVLFTRQIKCSRLQGTILSDDRALLEIDVSSTPGLCSLLVNIITPFSILHSPSGISSHLPPATAATAPIS